MRSFRYIATKTQLSDERSDADISLCNKVSWQGSARLKTCARAGCISMEHDPGEFKFCAKCTVTYYCSVACQTAAWQEHKGVCCTAAHACTSHALKSSLEMNKLMQDQLETKLQKVDGLMSTIKTSFSSAARDASIIADKKDKVQQLADLKPFLEYSVRQLADLHSGRPEETSKIAELQTSLEGTLARMSQFL